MGRKIFEIVIFLHVGSKNKGINFEFFSKFNFQFLGRLFYLKTLCLWNFEYLK